MGKKKRLTLREWQKNQNCWSWEEVEPLRVHLFSGYPYLLIAPSTSSRWTGGLGLLTETSPKYHIKINLASTRATWLTGRVFYAWSHQAVCCSVRNLPETNRSNLEEGTSTRNKGGIVGPYVTTHMIPISKATTAPFPCIKCNKN